MKTIQLPCYGMVVDLDDQGGGTIRSALAAAIDENPRDAVNSTALSCSFDAIESMVLAHACAGIDIASPAYLEGIETAVEKCFQAYGD